jgi:adenine-specific DNA-methyltransferase
MLITKTLQNWKHFRTLTSTLKCGNSLVSRFALDADLKTHFKKQQMEYQQLPIAVNTYRNAESKEQKREMEQLIADH